MPHHEPAATTAEESRPFTLPPCFPPTHGVRGDDGRTTFRAETFAVIEGYRNLLLDIVVPTASESGPPPVVVWVHGGAFVMGATEEVWSPWFADMRERVLAAGMAFAAITYRFSSEAVFPAQLLDARAGLRYIRHFASDFGVDGDRIALWGGSAGAQLALLVGLTAASPTFPDFVGLPGADAPVAAVVDYFGLADLATMQIDDPRGDHTSAHAPESRLLGGPVAERPDAAEAASPVTHVTVGAPPLLVVHGTADDAVPIEQSRRLVAAAERAGVPVELIEIEGANHGFADFDTGPTLDRTVAFLREALGR